MALTGLGWALPDDTRTGPGGFRHPRQHAHGQPERGRPGQHRPPASHSLLHALSLSLPRSSYSLQGTPEPPDARTAGPRVADTRRSSRTGEPASGYGDPRFPAATSADITRRHP
ncbi:hypothetical protein GCM10010278_44490 [Streptomyces melanogenes]|nr:hypothetical protein GCM10010278_44490 [Streptomyces melanogenes]